MRNKTSIVYNIIIVLLILIIAISSCIGIFAWAKYTSAINGTASAQVAKWSFKLVDGVTETTDVIDFAFTRTDGYGKVAQGKLAPGTFGEFEIGIDARGTETILEYEINIELENKPTYLKLYSDSAKTQEILVIDNKLTINGFMSMEDVKEIRTETIYWEWSYENGDDITDTSDSGKTMTMNISVTGYEVLEPPTDVEEDKKEEPDTYEITYDANGGIGAPESQVKTYDVDLTLSSTKPTRDGYNFLGWSTNSTATTATYAPGETYTENGNVTLYAIWKQATVITFTNGTDVSASGGNAAGDGSSSEATVPKGYTIYYSLSGYQSNGGAGRGEIYFNNVSKDQSIANSTNGTSVGTSDSFVTTISGTLKIEAVGSGGPGASGTGHATIIKILDADGYECILQ